jgi:alanine-glyoxylate transaminase / serine-glyoxylate transaminase / serine-pyruvate transaminase
LEYNVGHNSGRIAIFLNSIQGRNDPVTVHTGKHFLQIPGPSNVPDRVLRAMDMPTLDHRGPEFAQLGLEVLEGCKAVFRTKNPVVIYPSSGTGAWEAAIVNTLSPRDKVLMVETGHFATLWKSSPLSCPRAS